MGRKARGTINVARRVELGWHSKGRGGRQGRWSPQPSTGTGEC